MRLASFGWILAAGLVAIASPALADIPYLNGFETTGSVNDWFGPSGNAGGNITQVPSGGGTLQYTAAAGNDYAEITNTDSFGGNPFSRQGYGGFTDFGQLVTTQTTGYGQSFDLYVDLARWLPSQNPGSQLIISTHAGDTISSETGEFMNFAFTATTNGVLVQSVASSSLATITKSGWYQFITTFFPGNSGMVENYVAVEDMQNNVIGSTFYVPPQGSEAGSHLAGNGMLVLGPWNNGFAGDVLGFDNFQTFAAPEPMVLALAPCALALIRRRSR